MLKVLEHYSTDISKYLEHLWWQSSCENILPLQLPKAEPDSRSPARRISGIESCPGAAVPLMLGPSILNVKTRFIRKEKGASSMRAFEIPLLYLRNISGIRLRSYPVKIDEPRGKSHIEFWCKAINHNRGKGIRLARSRIRNLHRFL